jgi:hypothetical protein
VQSLKGQHHSLQQVCQPIAKQENPGDQCFVQVTQHQQGSLHFAFSEQPSTAHITAKQPPQRLDFDAATTKCQQKVLKNYQVLLQQA